MEDCRNSRKVKHEEHDNRSNSAYRKSKSSSVFHRDSKRELFKNDIDDDEERTELEDRTKNKEFDILILIEKVNYDYINEQFISKVKRRFMLNEISYDLKLSVPGIEGKILRISGDSLQDTGDELNYQIKGQNWYF